MEWESHLEGKSSQHHHTEITIESSVECGGREQERGKRGKWVEHGTKERKKT